ncbi:MAG: hypothetical protein QME62_06685 [Armatimonadota bacterium]|nr:hypothetical protein [Armatimonadota bacterium]
MERVAIKDIEVSRFILGTNPISGFSHQSVEMDNRMIQWFTFDRIKALLREAEALGINTVIARTDQRVLRFMDEYWNEGGKIQWFAQTCPSEGSPELCIDRAIRGGAKACHIHGGYMDHQFIKGELSHIPCLIEKIRSAGLLAGIAAHDPRVIEWAEEALDVDYYMCSYYNSMRRHENPAHVHGSQEWFLPEDRETMARLIQKLSKPAIHYKILAAGRNDPREAFNFAARAMRPQDMVCVGIYNENKPNMLKEDVDLFEEDIRGLKPQPTG